MAKNIKICSYLSVAGVTKCTAAGQREVRDLRLDTQTLDCNSKKCLSAINGGVILFKPPHVGSVKVAVAEGLCVPSQQR